MAQPERTKVAVLGSGSFGTTMATVVARNGYEVWMLTRREHVAHSINTLHTNLDYLSAFALPPSLHATTDPAAALAGAHVVVHCVPLQASEAFLQSIRALLPADAVVVSTAKGLHSASLEMMCDLLPRVLGPRPACFLSGPSFAKELMEGQPTGLVLASTDKAALALVRPLFASERVRVYASTDVVGVELGGALKNIFAIAAGAVEGLGLGMNTAAMLVTRGCKEMTRLARALGARDSTLSDLSGIGDLMLTCFGALSRNRTVGLRLGRGERIADILATSDEVAEGVATTPAALALARRLGVEAPIIAAVAAVLAGEKTAREAVMELMSYPVLDDVT